MASGFGLGCDIAKAGWLHRQSSVLHRWKKNWFVLDRDGNLRYFESPDSPRAQERIVIRSWVTVINTGIEAPKADPPEDHYNAKSCFLELVMTNKENMLLCAESYDDMRAWHIALEQARTIGHQGPNRHTTTTVRMGPQPYTTYTTSYGVSPYHSGYAYPGQVIRTNSVIQTTPGTTTVVVPQAGPQQIVYVDDSPYYHRRHYRGGLFMGPAFWW